VSVPRPDLIGKVAIVTGAARGTGFGIAERLLADGMRVVLVDIDGEGVREAGGRLDGQGEVLAVDADVADPEAARGFVEQAVERFGQLDLLVNNAAAMDRETLGRDTDLETVPYEVWDRTFAVNLFGPMVTCRHAMPHLIASGGSIVNISTIGGLRGRWNQVAYGVSKAGLNSLTEYIATIYGRSGVRCNAIAPGLVMTEQAEVNLDPKARAVSASDRLIARAGRPADIGAVVAFLASDDASYITGQVLVVDGGTINHVPGYASYAPGARIEEI
jgi:NAD(P)-dependent dehydrogenase (short-subunit alcohol dehydrogenase family)